MNEQKEIRAKSLEIAALIPGSSPDSPPGKYLLLAGEIEAYIKGEPGKSTFEKAEITGI
jgi:hypothetical protein